LLSQQTNSNSNEEIDEFIKRPTDQKRDNAKHNKQSISKGTDDYANDRHSRIEPKHSQMQKKRASLKEKKTLPYTSCRRVHAAHKRNAKNKQSFRNTFHFKYTLHHLQQHKKYLAVYKNKQQKAQKRHRRTAPGRRLFVPRVPDASKKAQPHRNKETQLTRTVQQNTTDGSIETTRKGVHRSGLYEWHSGDGKFKFVFAHMPRALQRNFNHVEDLHRQARHTAREK
jgi:hypothetical protein